MFLIVFQLKLWTWKAVFSSGQMKISHLSITKMSPQFSFIHFHTNTPCQPYLGASGSGQQLIINDDAKKIVKWQQRRTGLCGFTKKSTQCWLNCDLRALFLGSASKADWEWFKENSKDLIVKVPNYFSYFVIQINCMVTWLMLFKWGFKRKKNFILTIVLAVWII